jgi:hypothetical protein
MHGLEDLDRSIPLSFLSPEALTVISFPCQPASLRHDEQHVAAALVARVMHQVGVSIASGPGRFVRTKVVTLTPRFVVANKSCWSVRGYGIWH